MARRFYYNILCRTCGDTRDYQLRVRHPYCRRCLRTQYKRLYRTTPHGKAATLRAVKNYEARNPERKKAWQAVATFTKKPCEVCGDSDIIHKHHPDISKPKHIIHLCPLHHKQAHQVATG